MILIVSREERELIARLRRLEPIGEATALNAQIVALKREIVDLEIAKAKREEDFARQERELRHMVGLERQRQDAERGQHTVELVQASHGAKLDVREENLKAEQARFAEHLRFNTERFATMEKYLKDMLTDILARLPNITVAMTK